MHEKIERIAHQLTERRRQLEADGEIDRFTEALLADPIKIPNHVAQAVVMGVHPLSWAIAQRLTEAQITELRGRLEPRSHLQEYEETLPPVVPIAERSRNGIEPVRTVEHRIREFRGVCPQVSFEFTVTLSGEESERLRLALNQVKPEYSLEFDRCCHNCAYFMKGVKMGEPSICNAFHSPHAPMETHECQDFENRFARNP